ASVARNLEQVRRRIEEAAVRVGRDPDEVTLVAISKLFPLEKIQEAYEAGIKQFGENRVYEAAEKIPQIKMWVQEEGGEPITWHMVGHLQRRKVEDACGLFHLIHSVDRVKLARRIDLICGRAEEIMPILLEVNVSGEESKYGFDLGRWPEGEEQLMSFLADVGEMLELPHIKIRGLMTMAPLVEDPEETRPVFRGLRELRDLLQEEFPSACWEELSMGMSNDFEVAVEEGATMLRLGRIVFGPRPHR
ncbi:MAG: YggS family pyridoxal phosphate-dependent enzyme, partial [Chloroflexota bacterium]|nr:YggS family pyridoxal phosphate-dependent enzyme [Chloroflexota bacterium]